MEENLDVERTFPESSPESSGLYRPPMVDILLALEVAGIMELLNLNSFSHVDQDSLVTTLEQFGKFSSSVIAPTDGPGDKEGSRFDRQLGKVVTPECFKSAYKGYVDGGWGAISFPLAHGGGGFPSVVGIALQEIFASSNVALSLNAVLTQSAVEVLLAWGTEDQRTKYIPNLITGNWSGTMNLTEPDAGSDLSGIKTTGVLDEQGIWRISGTKIFITWGDHDLAENVIHFVLARTLQGSTGTEGLSLFLVPRNDSSHRDQNDVDVPVKCVRVEEKLGLHGSPTCVMEYSNAFGELVGPLHFGLRTMFTMMNLSRLSIGVQGPAVAEKAFQLARQYANDRIQGRIPGVLPPARSPIIDHLDVRRMLLLMTTSTQASRLLLYFVCAQRDFERGAPDADSQMRSHQYLDLLTPIAKAWSTDVGFAATSLGVQVLGGAGYIEELGMAQRLRDARIASIYEGTNGIQAIDLVTRKVTRDGGKWVTSLFDEVRDTIASESTFGIALGPTFRGLERALSDLTNATNWMSESLTSSIEDALAGATAYLELFGITIGGWLMACRARTAISQGHTSLDRAVSESNFFALEYMGRSSGLRQLIKLGATRLNIQIGDQNQGM